MVCSQADTTLDTKIRSIESDVLGSNGLLSTNDLINSSRAKTSLASTKGRGNRLALSLIVSVALSSTFYLPPAAAAEPRGDLSGEVQQNVFDSEEERNLFLLDLALTSPDKGVNHILVHENVSHKNGDSKVHAALASIAAPSISNFDIVSEGLWRGAAPSNQAMQKLAESGVKTIVDLRLAGPGAAEEATKAKKLGIKYVHIPLGFMGPSLFKVAQFLNIVNDPANQPVFVHCRYGADRTGALVAVFRVIHDHWTFSQAYTEMRSHHFKPWLASLKLMVARVGGNAKIQQELKTLANKSLASSNL
ncbi:tyrosine-protein phosphatase [bacterium]|nr:tyrosine-protein phosphatase [bacterium]MBP9808843.1 tyrosine-protein phosphatase [bacterium]